MQFSTFELEQVVDEMETKHGVSLSTGARQSLIIPVLEAQSFGSTVSNHDVERSIGRIIEAASQHEDPLSGNRQQITAVAVARAIHLKFCNIPPFCSPVRQTKRTP